MTFLLFVLNELFVEALFSQKQRLSENKNIPVKLDTRDDQLQWEKSEQKKTLKFGETPDFVASVTAGSIRSASSCSKKGR